MSGREKRYKQAINQGHTAAWDQQWDRAAAFYRQALTDVPDDLNALNSLALALFEMQEYKESLQFYVRVIKKTPKDPVPIEKAARLYEILQRPDIGASVAVRAAELYLNNGDIEKAIENWNRSLGMDPQQLAVHSRLAVVYERLKQVPQAAQEYLHIASLMQQAGERDKAVQAVNRALMISPNLEEAQHALDLLRDNLPLPKPENPQVETDPKVASVPFLNPPEMDVDQDKTPVEVTEKKALSVLAALFFEQTGEGIKDQKSRAQGEFDSIVRGTGPINVKNIDRTKLMLNLGQAVEYLASGDNDRGAAELKRVIDIGLDHPAAYFFLGKLRMDSNRLESAIRYLKRTVSHADYALASRLLMADVYRKKDQVREASLEYLEALRLADSQVVPEKNADGLRQLYEPIIETHAQSSDEGRFVKVCETISDILDRPHYRQYLMNLRKELLPGDDGLLVPLAEMLTEIRSSDVVVALSAIRELVQGGHHQAAFEEALFALEDGPTYLPLHIAIGDLLESRNQNQSAIDKYKVVAHTYGIRGEAGRAIDMLRRVVKMAPLDLDTRERLIGQLITRGQSEDAIEELIQLAEVHYSLAELSDARKTYTRTLRLIQSSGLNDTWRVKILRRVADIDIQSLNWRQALTVYHQICSLRPNDLDANRDLVILNFRLGERKQALIEMEKFIQVLNSDGKVEDGIDFLEKLIEDWPQQAMIRNCLADQYQVVGRMDAAVQQLAAASEIYTNMGNKDGAIRMLRKIIPLNPPDIEKYHDLLENAQSN